MRINISIKTSLLSVCNINTNPENIFVRKCNLITRVRVGVGDFFKKKIRDRECIKFAATLFEI